jgi:hypothetical protein
MHRHVLVIDEFCWIFALQQEDGRASLRFKKRTPGAGLPRALVVKADQGTK